MLSIDTISAEELDAYVGRQDAVIIDLRDAEEYERSHVKTAVNIPYEEIQRCRRFPKDKLLVLYCSRGSSSLFAARELMKMGYIHICQEELFDDIQVDVVQDPETWTHLTEFADE